jgi:hypothetical protein
VDKINGDRQQSVEMRMLYLQRTLMLFQPKETEQINTLEVPVTRIMIRNQLSGFMSILILTPSRLMHGRFDVLPFDTPLHTVSRWMLHSPVNAVV